MGRKALEKDQEQGTCILCNKNKQMPRARSKFGYKRYTDICSRCHKEKYGDFTHKNRNRKKTSCERCGFIPEDMCQLDVHHMDRNNKNNNPSNLKTLCSNCHRLEHREDVKEWAKLGG